MSMITLSAASVAAIAVFAATTGAIAQTSAKDPHHPDETLTEIPSMPPRAMMGGLPMMGARGNMMNLMFAIADTDGDDALSFEEVTAIHKRVFDKVDADKDGKVTSTELQAFLRE